MAKTKGYPVGYGLGAVPPKENEQLVDGFVSEQDGVTEVRRLGGGQRVLNMTEEAAVELGSRRAELVVEEDSTRRRWVALTPGGWRRIRACRSTGSICRACLQGMPERAKLAAGSIEESLGRLQSP